MARDNLPRAFTLQFNGRTRVLRDDDVGVSEAYDPASGEPKPSAIRVNAVWDTGATSSVINKEVILALGLRPIDKQKIYTANGERIADVYLVNIHLANGVIFPGLRVSDGDILGSSVLIGMDIIGRGDFAVTNHQGKTCMSFQVPSSRRIDFVRELELEKKAREKRRSRKSRKKRK